MSLTLPPNLPTLSSHGRRQQYRSYRLDLAGITQYKRKLRREGMEDPSPTSAAESGKDHGDAETAGGKENSKSSKSPRKEAAPKRTFGIIDRFNAAEKAKKDQKENEKHKKQQGNAGSNDDDDQAKTKKDEGEDSESKMSQADQDKQIERLSKVTPIPKPPPVRTWQEIWAQETGSHKKKDEKNSGPKYKNDEAFVSHFYQDHLDRRQKTAKKLNSRYAGKVMGSPRTDDTPAGKKHGGDPVTTKCATAADELEMVDRYYTGAVERQKGHRAQLETKYLKKKWERIQTRPPAPPVPSKRKPSAPKERAATAPAKRNAAENEVGGS